MKSIPAFHPKLEFRGGGGEGWLAKSPRIFAETGDRGLIGVRLRYAAEF